MTTKARKTAPRGRPKDAAKRDGIVRAASSLFFRDGYELTSMEAVARKADVSKLTIYSHFADKDELFREAVRCRCDARAMPETFMALAKEPVEKALLHIATHLVELLFSPESLRLHRIMQAEAAHHPRAVRIFYEAGPKRVRAAFGNLLRDWHRQKRLDIPDVPRAVEQFFSLLKGELMNKTLMLLAPPPHATARRRHAQATVALFLTAYGSKGVR